MMHNWDGDWGVGNWLLMGLGMLLFWAIVVAAIVLLIHYPATRSTTTEHRVSFDKPGGPTQPSAPDASGVGGQ